MAAKKKAVGKKKASASGSDRGAKMKADNAQKKSQAKAASKSASSPLNMTYTQQKNYGYKASNDLAGTYGESGLGARGGFVGRGSQRLIDQSKRAEKKVAKKAAAKKLETAKKTKRKER